MFGELFESWFRGLQDKPGTKKEELIKGEDGLMTKITTFISEDGTYECTETQTYYEKDEKEELTKRIQEAVQNEDYELAAKLKRERDEF